MYCGYTHSRVYTQCRSPKSRLRRTRALCSIPRGSPRAARDCESRCAQALERSIYVNRAPPLMPTRVPTYVLSIARTARTLITYAAVARVCTYIRCNNICFDNNRRNFVATRSCVLIARRVRVYVVVAQRIACNVSLNGKLSADSI